MTKVHILKQKSFITDHRPLNSYQGMSVLIPHLELYADRALVMQAASFVPNGQCGSLRDAFDFYQKFGLCSEAVFPKNGTEDDASIECVLQDLRAGRKMIQFFSPTPDDEDLIREAGLEWGKVVFGPSARLATQANNKVFQRLLARHINMNHVFPEYVICHDLSEVSRAVVKMNLQNGHGLGVFCKRPDLASGVGMHRAHAMTENIHDFCNEIFDTHHQLIIVERVVQKDLDFSGHFVLDDLGVHWEGSTLQFIVDEVCHDGNLLASHDGMLGLSHDLVSRMQSVSYPFAQFLWLEGYRGVLVFDFIRDVDGVIWLTELNARVSFGTYGFDILRQLEKLRKKPTCLYIKTLKIPSAIKDFTSLCSHIPDILFNGTEGILPFLTRMIEPAHKVGLVAVGSQASYVIQMMRQLEKRLHP